MIINLMQRVIDNRKRKSETVIRLPIFFVGKVGKSRYCNDYEVWVNYNRSYNPGIIFTEKNSANAVIKLSRAV